MAKETHGANFIVRWDKYVTETSDFIWQSYLDYDQFNAQVIGRRGYTFDTDFRYSSYNVNHDNQLTWGAGYRYIADMLSFDNLLVQHRYPSSQHSTYNVFIQDKYGIIPDLLYTTVGTKVEHNYDTGLEFQPSLRLAYYPQEGSTLNGLV